MILLPEVNERAKMVPIVSDEVGTPGQRFMFRLLIESLLSPWEIQHSIQAAINSELHFEKIDDKNKKHGERIT